MFYFVSLMLTRAMAFLCSATVLLLSSSCTEENLHPSSGEGMSRSEAIRAMLGVIDPPEDIYGQLGLVGIRSDDIGRTRYSLDATFFNSLDPDRNAIDVGTVTVSDISWQYEGPEGFPEFHYNWSSPWDESTMPTLGGTGAWGIDGNTEEQVPAITATMYVPQEVIISAPNVNSPSVSRSNGITINWNADPSNTLGVLVGVTRGLSAAIPAGGLFVKPWYTITEDDGEFHLPGSAIDQVDAGEGVEFVILRGNIQYLKVEGKDYALTAMILHKVQADVVD